ncbi:MAG: hypothetical protein JWM80_4340 [Cyanobacteria bacterium RYN_339]|nr:hypothetical protein [Cyanobacteria bacterium RYN_339]
MSAMLPPAPPAFTAYLEDQGHTDGCGTTSLGMVLSFWESAPGRFHRRLLDRDIRSGGTGLDFAHLEKYATAHGYRIGTGEHGTPEGLGAWLDHGVPVVLLIENGPAPAAGALHFVVALRRTEEGLLVADPKGGRLRELPYAELAWRWSDLRVGPVGTGIDRAFAVVLPARPVPVADASGKITSSDAYPLPAPAHFDWRCSLFGAYVDFCNTF